MITDKLLGSHSPAFLKFIEENIDLINAGDLYSIYKASPHFFNMTVILMLEADCMIIPDPYLSGNKYYKLERSLDWVFCLDSNNTPYLEKPKKAAKLKNYCLFKSLSDYAEFMYAAYKDRINCAIFSPHLCTCSSDVKIVSTKYGNCYCRKEN